MPILRGVKGHVWAGVGPALRSERVPTSGGGGFRDDDKQSLTLALVVAHHVPVAIDHVVGHTDFPKQIPPSIGEANSQVQWGAVIDDRCGACSRSQMVTVEFPR